MCDSAQHIYLPIVDSFWQARRWRRLCGCWRKTPASCPLAACSLLWFLPPLSTWCSTGQEEVEEAVRLLEEDARKLPFGSL